MGKLTPGAQYIYERNGDTIYRRESGSDPSTREVVGYDARTGDGRPLIEHIKEDKLWGEIRRAAETNPALQQALDRAILLYRLSKDNPV
jgi:hypothetical protein